MSTRVRAGATAAKALVAVLFAALVVVGFPVPAAHAAAGIDLTLTVTTKAGSGIAGLNVYAYEVRHHTIVGDGVRAAYVGGNKTYTVSLDTAKDYTFYFDAPGATTTAFDQYWGGSTWPEEARVWDWDDPGLNGRLTLNIALATNSTITGKVTGSSGKALSGISVYPWRFDGNGWFRLANAVATTSSTGVYTMRNLEPGSYRLEFSPPNTTGYLREYSGNTTLRDAAAPVIVGLGATVTSNAALTTGGSLSGTVKIFNDDILYSPYGITAFAFRVIPSGPDAGKIDTEIAYAGKPTGRDGKWTVNGLPAGAYKIKLYDTAASEFVDKWVGSTAMNPAGSDTVAGAVAYSVQVGKTTVTTGSPRLDYYDTLASTTMELNVQDAAGAPLGDDSVVYIESMSGEDFFFQSTADFGLRGGNLKLLFMPEGDYKVWIDPDDAISQPFIGTRSIAAGSASNTWNIPLAPLSPFSYSVPATETHSSTAVGSLITVNRGKTTLDDGVSPDSNVEYTYLWLRDGNPIFGSQSRTTSSYTTTGADLGHQVSVIVRAEAFGYPPVFTALDVVVPTMAPAPQSVAGDPPTVSAPAAAVPGSTLTARPGTWNTAGLTFAYRWLRDGVEIPGATARTYKTVLADAGHEIGFEITASKPGYATGAAVASAAAVPIGTLAAPRQTKAAKFTVTAVAGGVKVVASPGTWSPAPSSYGYAWKVGGVDVGTSSSTLLCVVEGTPACENSGLAIEVTITAHRPGYADGARNVVVRKGTRVPTTHSAGFVYDSTAGGHPTIGANTDPAQLGHVLRVTDPVYGYPADRPGAQSRSYLWQRLVGSKWTTISKATKATYVPVAADVNRQLRVRVITTSGLYPSVTQYLLAGTGKTRLDLLNGAAPAVAVQGTALAGTTKKALITGAWPVSGVTQKYQWYVCSTGCTDPSPTWTPISKATSATFVPGAAYNDRYLSVAVTGSKSGYASRSVRSEAFAISSDADPDAITAFTDPTFASGVYSGQAVVGKALTVKPVVLDRTAGVTRQYSWTLCDAADCSGVKNAAGVTTKPSIVPDGMWLVAGEPRWLRVEEQVSLGGVPMLWPTSTTLPLVAGTWAPTKPASLSASTTIAPGTTTWTLRAATWPAATYNTVATWYVGTTAWSNDTTFARAPGSEPVYVEVVTTRTGYLPVKSVLVARKGVLAAQPKAISGARYGDTLTAPAVTIPVAAGSKIAYQWYSGTKAIKKQTKATLTPGTAYIGKALKVKITVTSPYYATASYYSTPVTLGSHLAATGAPVIVSPPAGAAPGAKLTANLTGFGPGLSYSYLWERSADAGTTWAKTGTASSYTVLTSDVTKQLRLRVVAKRTGWTATAWIASAPVTVGYGPALALTAPFELSTPAKVDVPLVASTAWNTTGYALTYSWTRNGVTIPGATGAAVTPTASWQGDLLQAHVTATKAGYLPVTVSSDTVVVGAGNPPSATVTIARSGTVLTATPAWNVGGVTFGYEWTASTAPGVVAGTGVAFDIAAYPTGTTLTVTIQGTSPGYSAVTVVKTYKK